MAKKAIFRKNDFTGGIAEGSRSGIKNSFQDGNNLDYRTDPDVLTLNKALTKDSGSTVTDLVKWMVEYKGQVIGYGNTGKIYKRATDGTWSNPKTVSGSTGQGIEVFNDEIWYADSDGIGKTSGLSGGSPTFSDDYFVTPTYEAPDVYNLDNSSNSYTAPSAVNEGITHRKTWTTTVSTVAGFVFRVNSVGTATSITIIVHDSSNNLVGQRTIPIASVGSNFRRHELFLSNLTIGNQYHVHILSSNGTATVRVATSSDLETARISILQILKDADVDISSSNFADNYLVNTTYTSPAEISESLTDKLTFTPTVSSLSAISLSFEGSALRS